MDDKILASIGILTLNSGRTLRACLESVKDFAEIIICDGNSTDNTLDIAREYGAKIIKQYETDEPNLTCVTDKAAVRQKNMEAASYDWYFFMDSDDTLSPEAVAEIRAIVAKPDQNIFVWRMPTRIFIAGREIKHASIYPSYQIRFFNRKIGIRFRGPVHDRIVFDEKIYPVGELRSLYNYEWPSERVKNIRPFLKKYVERETLTAGRTPLTLFIRTDIYRSLKTAFGYLLYRIPKNYLFHGFKNSLPLRVEFYLLFWYNIALVYSLIKKRINGLRGVIFFWEILRKKDIERIMVNIALKDTECFGKILDLGGGKIRASHYRFLRIVKWARIKTADVNPDSEPDYVLNIETDKIPSADASFNFVLAFNLLEHLKSPANLFDEALRVLMPGGKIIGSIPFLMDVHPDPHDYVRLTKEQLQILFAAAGFKNIKIGAVGSGPFVAGYYQIDFLIPRIFKLIIIPLVFLLDKIVQKLKPRINFKERYPLAYIFEAQR